jgi:hypothetical protein
MARGLLHHRPMHLRLLFVVVLALLPGCKSMGSVMSGFGKVAAGAARLVPDAAVKATPVIAKGVAQVGGAVARSVVRATPEVLRTTASVAEALVTSSDFWMAVPIEVAPPAGAADPCLICPLDAECGECVGYAGYACVESPAGALGRCESSAPPDAASAPGAGAPSTPPGAF